MRFLVQLLEVALERAELCVERVPLRRERRVLAPVVGGRERLRYRGDAGEMKGRYRSGVGGRERLRVGHGGDTGEIQV